MNAYLEFDPEKLAAINAGLLLAVSERLGQEPKRVPDIRDPESFAPGDVDRAIELMKQYPGSNR